MDKKYPNFEYDHKSTQIWYIITKKMSILCYTF